MKKLKVLWILIIIICFCSITVMADDDVAKQQADALETENIEEGLTGDAQEIMGDQSITDGVDTEKITENLYEKAKDSLTGIVKESVVNASVLVFAAMLCSIVSSLIKTNGLGDVDYITLVGVIAVAALSFGGIQSFVNTAKQVMDEIDTFAKMLLPALTAAAAAGGTAASASAKYAIVSMFMSLLITMVNSVIFPLIYAYMATSVAAVAFGGDSLAGASELIKWAATNILTVTVLIFTVYITVSGVVSGTADAATTKLAKTVLATALPVVGSIISDAAGTVLSGAQVLKNSIGVFGLFAVLAICLVPFLKLGINYLIYKAAAMLAATVADKNISKAISSVSTAIGIVLGAVGTCAIMLFFSIISVIKAVGVL